VPSSDFREFLLQIVDRPRPEKKVRYRESLGTHILGTLSLALGIAALLRISDIWRGAELINQSISAELHPPPESQARFIPPYDAAFVRYCGIALAGLLLGIAGVWRSRKLKRTRSLVSVIGIVTCAVASSPVYGLIVVWTIVLGSPILLASAALVLVVQMVKAISKA
jgi:hypothetical protein